MDNIYVVCALAALSAALVYLRVTAPKTKTTLDDKALEVLEKVESVVEAVEPKKP